MSEVHDNISPLIAAYALGAMPEEEIPAVRAHILSCEQCFAEAESFAASMSALSDDVEPVALSKGFEDRVLSEATGGEVARSSRRTWFPNLRLALVSGSALLVVALLVLATVSMVGSAERERRFRDVVAALVQDPDAISLEGPGGAEAILASTDEGSVLVTLDLGEAPEGRDYQLWLMRDGVPTPADTFDVSDSVVIVESGENLEGYDGAAITVEPEGGSDLPTTEPVLSG